MKLSINLIVFLFLFLNSLFLIKSEKNIKEYSQEELKANLEVFNQWFSEKTKINSLELRLVDGEVGVFTKEKFDPQNLLLDFYSSICISSQMIYHGPYAEFIKEIEAKYGYDESTYLVILLLHEYFSEGSYWKPYLDILPSKPKSPIEFYWTRAGEIEPEIMGTTIIRKIVDYKINLEKKARGLNRGLFSTRPELFDAEIFSESNIEWALYIIDSRVQSLNFT